MLKWIITVLLSVSLLCTGQCAEKRSLALVVGINGYRNGTALTCAAADAEKFAKFCKDPNQGGLQPADVVLLHDGASGTAPSRSAITNALDQMCSQAKQGDRLIFFFTGHGISVGGKSYIVPGDGSDDTSSLIPAEEIVGKLSESGASEVLLFIDACRTTSGVKAGGVAKQILTDEFAKAFRVEPRLGGPRMTATLYACSVGESAYEWPEKNDGVFTYYMLDGLSGAADKDQNGVTLNELQQHVGDKVKEHARAYPAQKQTPWIDMKGEAGSLLLSQAICLDCGGHRAAKAVVSCPADEDDDAKSAVMDALDEVGLTAVDVSSADARKADVKVIINKVRYEKRHTASYGMNIESLDAIISATVVDLKTGSKVIPPRSFVGSIPCIGPDTSRRTDACTRAAEALAKYIATKLGVAAAR